MKHEGWLVQFGRTYKDEEVKSFRRHIFNENMKYIESVNNDGHFRLNEGCNGGFVDDAFNFIINNGLPTESSYPYKGFNGTCSNKEGLRGIAMYPSYPTAAIIN
ncbi:hypothetical protein LIER_26347 [Lithospermum erythrorhizon]|uniref:Uncharacterized protein n=1 Tax=Lithospermum erythrorhizon TaxID=34254 RepID=A0AAV3R8A2_LITER